MNLCAIAIDLLYLFENSWDSAWSRNGASNNPCSESYCGIRPFSDKEPKAMADFILTKRGNIAAYFAIHSFSQLWMYPYGYTNALPPNNRQLVSNFYILSLLLLRIHFVEEIFFLKL
jgi:hypothetical protein